LDDAVRLHADAPTPEIAQLIDDVRIAAAADPLDLTDVVLRAWRRDVALRDWFRHGFPADRPWRALPPDDGYRAVQMVWAIRSLINALGAVGDVDRGRMAAVRGFSLLALIPDEASRLSRCCELGSEVAGLLPPECVDPFVDLAVSCTVGSDTPHGWPVFILRLMDVGRLDAAERCMDAYARVGAGGWTATYVEMLTYADHFAAAERAAFQRLDGMALTKALSFLARRLAETGEADSALRVADIVAERRAADPGDPNVFDSEAVNVPPVTLEIAINLASAYATAGATDQTLSLLPGIEAGLYRRRDEWAGHTTANVLRLADQVGDRPAARRLHRKALTYRNLRILAEVASRDVKVGDERGFAAATDALSALPPAPPYMPSFIGMYLADERKQDPARADRLATIPAIRAALDAEPAALRSDYQYVRHGSSASPTALAHRLATTPWSDCLDDLARFDPPALRAVADAELA
jgi:hypothetical protein